MNRLTRYDEKQKQYVRVASRLAVDNKLGKLEDLEEQIGYSLEVLINNSQKDYVFTYLCEHLCSIAYNSKGDYHVINFIITDKKVYKILEKYLGVIR